MGWYTDKNAEYYLKHKKAAKDLIKEVACSLCEYNEDFDIIDNPALKWYDSSCDEAYLGFPYAINLKVYNSRYELGTDEDYGEILYLNEDLDGFFYEYDGITTDVNDATWLYLGYAHKLVQIIRKQKDEINKLKGELNEYRAVAK